MAAITASVEDAYRQQLLDFLAYLELERGLSRNTLEAYRTDLLQYGAFLERRGVDVLDAGHGDVTAFLDELAAGDDERAPAAAATLQRKAACLRSFYRHLRREQIMDRDPTADLRAPRKLQRSRRSSAATRWRACWRAARHRAGRPARPRAARADVRLRPARLGGDGPSRRRPRPERAGAARSRQGLEGAARPGRARGARRGRGSTCSAAARSSSAFATSRTSSSTSAAAASAARGSTRSSSATRVNAGWRTG